MARTNLAQALRARAGPGDVAEARRLLGLALGAARSLRVPETDAIREILGALPAEPNNPAASSGKVPPWTRWLTVVRRFSSATARRANRRKPKP